jgi:hypothetical protein
VAALVFLAIAPFTTDSYNTMNNRSFVDLVSRGNPYTLAPGITLTFRGETFSLDWPYPPAAILLVFPAWLSFQATGSEALYQLLFKLPLFGAVVLSAILLQQIKRDTCCWGVGRLLFNPGVLLLATVSGGFDAVVMGLLLAAYLALIRRSATLSAILLGVAIGLRLYPAILLPVMVSWIQRGDRGRAALRYAALTLGVAGILLAPSVLDLPGFIATTSSLKTIGPFSSSVLLNAALYKLLPAAALEPGASWQPEDVSYTLMALLTLFSVVAIYVAAHRRGVELLPALLAVLLSFYALYPRMHALYVLGLLPLSLLTPSWPLRWVWLPGTAWYLLFNGAFGSTGLPYFVAPLTGAWIQTYRLLHLPGERWPEYLWWSLIAIYMGLALTAAWTLLQTPRRVRESEARVV